MSKQDIRNRIAAARGQSQSPAANHAARPAQHQAQTTGGAAGTSLRSRDIASRIEAARAKRIQELAASQTGLRRDTAARDDAGARDRFAQRHPEYTGGEAGAANRARNSEKVLRQAAEAAALGEGAKRLNKSENGFGGQDTRRGSVTGLFEQKDSSGGYPGFGGNAATDLRSPNGYVSMADLNAKTNGTSYPGVQGGTTVNGGESALSAELSGLKWDAEDSGKRVEQGIQAMEELAALNREFVARNISPGGCADLLAIAIFFVRLQELMDERKDRDQPCCKANSAPRKRLTLTWKN